MATAVTLAIPSPGTPGGLARTDLRRSRPKGSSSRESFENSLAQSPEKDPLRILAPAQKKLTTIESQRVLAVMDEAIRRMDGALLLPFLADSLERFSVSLGSVLVSMIEEYQGLAMEYTALYDALQLQGITPREGENRTVSDERERTPSATSLKGDATKPTRLEPLSEDCNTEEKFYQVRHRLKHCAKSILRALNQNPPTSSPLLQSVAKERSRAATQLLGSVNDLHGTVNERLLTTQSEEVKRKEQLTRVAERQKDYEEQIRKLEDDLQKAKQHKDEEVAKRNAQIKRLKSNIKTVINLADDANRRVRTDAAKQQASDLESHENTKAALVTEIGNLKRKLQENQAAHREKEQEARKRAFKREAEVENWIQKYDNEVGEQQEELEALGAEFEEEKEQLKELNEKLEILTIEYEVVVKEQEEARKNAEAAKKKLDDETRAAGVIQRVWRAYRERTKKEREAKKGKKGKKGKGKGKKKKN